MFFKRLSSIWLAMSLAIAGALVASEAAVSAATIVVVSHDGQHGWNSRITDGNGAPNSTYGSVTFVTGPGTPPRGTGSLRLMTNTGKGDGSAQMRNTNYAGVRLTSLSELTYYAYSAVNNGQQFPYLTLNVNNTGGSSLDDTLFFEPPYQQPATGNPSCPDQGPTLMVTWQKWDSLHGCWWDNNGELGSGGLLGVQPLSVYMSTYPNAVIVNPSGVGGLRVAVGFASPTDNFDGNVDLVTVGVNGSSTTSYDFEPPTCKEADGNGDFHSNDGRQGNVQMDNDKCEESGVGGNGDSDQGDSVDSTNRGDGRDFHSTNIESTQFDAVAGTMTITGVGTTGGTPVVFTLIAVGNSLTSLGSITMIFRDGYTITGDLVDGSIALN